MGLKAACDRSPLEYKWSKNVIQTWNRESRAAPDSAEPWGQPQALCHTASLLCQAHGQNWVSLQGISWKCSHMPDSSDTGKGYEEQVPFLRGQGEANALMRHGRKAQLGPRARSPGAPTGSQPCLFPLHTPRQHLSGFFPLLFPLLAVLPPSSDEGVGDWLTAHFPAQQVMHAFGKGCSQGCFFKYLSTPPELWHLYWWGCMFYAVFQHSFSG